jgi:undecaprenyl-diphosphatase
MLQTLLSWDVSVLAAINRFATQSVVLDQLAEGISDNNLAKGVPVMMLFWGLWFADRRLGPETRPRLLAVLATTLVAIGVGRLLAGVLPFRERPIHTEWLEVNLPSFIERASFTGWSSMPSDHAVLYFALATGFWLVNRWAGLAVLIHTLFVICLPRVFLGFHFPSDILVGAIVGTIIALALVPPLARFFEKRSLSAPVLDYPYLWYPLMFLITFETASVFGASRGAAHTLVEIAVRYLS